MFIASRTTGQYESLTDPARGEPYTVLLVRVDPFRPSQWTPSASSAALMYYGPSEPMDASGNPRRLDPQVIRDRRPRQNGYLSIGHS